MGVAFDCRTLSIAGCDWGSGRRGFNTVAVQLENWKAKSEKRRVKKRYVFSLWFDDTKHTRAAECPHRAGARVWVNTRIMFALICFFFRLCFSFQIGYTQFSLYAYHIHWIIDTHFDVLLLYTFCHSLSYCLLWIAFCQHILVYQLCFPPSIISDLKKSYHTLFHTFHFLLNPTTTVCVCACANIQTAATGSVCQPSTFRGNSVILSRPWLLLILDGDWFYTRMRLKWNENIESLTSVEMGESVPIPPSKDLFETAAAAAAAWCLPFPNAFHLHPTVSAWESKGVKKKRMKTCVDCVCLWCEKVSKKVCGLVFSLEAWWVVCDTGFGGYCSIHSFCYENTACLPVRWHCDTFSVCVCVKWCWRVCESVLVHVRGLFVFAARRWMKALKPV